MDTHATTTRSVSRATGLAFALLLLTSVGRVDALPIVQATQIGQQSGLPAPLTFEAFDPTLGTLDSVQLQVDGAIQTTAIVPPAVDAQGNVFPVPFATRVEQQFLGLTLDLSFQSPAQLQQSGVGFGPMTFAPVPVGYVMTFDAQSDLFGFVVPAFSGFTTPPLSVSAPLGTFVGNEFTLASGLQLDSLLTAVMLTSAGSVSATFNGAVILTYEYTPFEAEGEDPVAVAEPEIVGLLAGGMLLMAALRRRRSAAARRRDGPMWDDR